MNINLKQESLIRGRAHPAIDHTLTPHPFPLFFKVSVNSVQNLKQKEGRCKLLSAATVIIGEVKWCKKTESERYQDTQKYHYKIHSMVRHLCSEARYYLLCENLYFPSYSQLPLLTNETNGWRTKFIFQKKKKI